MKVVKGGVNVGFMQGMIMHFTLILAREFVAVVIFIPSAIKKEVYLYVTNCSYGKVRVNGK